MVSAARPFCGKCRHGQIVSGDLGRPAGRRFLLARLAMLLQRLAGAKTVALSFDAG
jgi:hypothetical protein